MDAGVVAQGLGTLAVGMVMIIGSHWVWGSSEWLAKMTDSVMRGRNRPQSDWDRAKWWLRFTMVCWMVFGGILFVSGVVSVIVGFRR